MYTFLLLSLLGGHYQSPKLPAPDTSVYICDSAKGKKYHYKNDCHGLSNCQHKIIRLSLQDAKKQGKTRCGFEK